MPHESTEALKRLTGLTWTRLFSQASLKTPVSPKPQHIAGVLRGRRDHPHRGGTAMEAAQNHTRTPPGHARTHQNSYRTHQDTSSITRDASRTHRTTQTSKQRQSQAPQPRARPSARGGLILFQTLATAVCACARPNRIRFPGCLTPNLRSTI